MSDCISVERAEEVIDAEQYVTIQTVSRHRWYTRQLVVFNTAMFGLTGFYYLRPATEEQEGQDRFEGDPVPIFKVKARQIASTVFEAAND